MDNHFIAPAIILQSFIHAFMILLLKNEVIVMNTSMIAGMSSWLPYRMKEGCKPEFTYTIVTNIVCCFN